jgi:hypothetical protein
MDTIEVTRPGSGSWHDTFFRENFVRMLDLMPDEIVADRLRDILEETPTGTIQVVANIHEWKAIAAAWNALVLEGRSRRG